MIVGLSRSFQGSLATFREVFLGTTEPRNKSSPVQKNTHILVKFLEATGEMLGYGLFKQIVELSLLNLTEFFPKYELLQYQLSQNLPDMKCNQEDKKTMTSSNLKQLSNTIPQEIRKKKKYKSVQTWLNCF